MSDEIRVTVHRTVSEYLKRQAPQHQEEFAVVFDPCYRAASQNPELMARDPFASEGSGIGIESSLVEGTLISIAVHTAILLCRQVWLARDAEERIRRIERACSKLEAMALPPGLAEALVSLLEELAARGEIPWPETEGKGIESSTEGSAPPELQLFVDRRGDQLRYRLVGERFGIVRADHGSVDLPPSAAREYFQRFFDDLEGLRWSEGESFDATTERLLNRGETLSRALLPDGLWSALDRLAGRARSLEILAEEPLVPWELLALRSARGRPPHERFLGSAFALTRRLPRPDRPDASRLPLSRISVIVAEDSELPFADQERDHLLSLAGSGRRVNPLKATFQALTRAIAEAGLDGLHFVGHGQADLEAGAHFALTFDQQFSVTADELPGESPTFRRCRPLVFLNACRAARDGLSLTGLDGWASRFVDLGAGAFIAPIWAVRDRRAATFAEAFYEAFVGGAPICEAARSARHAVRRKWPGDPAWLAYAVYARSGAVCAAVA